ncbi:unnamed protein product [Symbiodinium pilosum]|uniref:Uncharacterized protein n=1 Tax=Symbiodinium pilosum TaxID=2952 RepID=A0A812LGW3_SYMPI|nr:unnamed protein product [Symbiodinium pilosum]
MSADQMVCQIGEVCASGKPEFEQSSLGVVLDNLPPPCKPDLDLVDVSLCPIYPIESESREDQSWTLNLRTPSTSSLTPRYHDVPPGTLLPPDGRSHWLHVMRMNEFCKDVTAYPPKFKHTVLQRRQRDLDATENHIQRKLGSCMAMMASLA